MIRYLISLVVGILATIPIYITKDLVWYSSGCLRYIDSFNNYNLIEKYATKVNLVNKKGRFVLQTTGLFKRAISGTIMESDGFRDSD